MSDDFLQRIAVMTPEQRTYAIAHPFASEIGIELIVRLLMSSGAMCHQCGYGTRPTSKNWARCKRCWARVRRQPFPLPCS